MKRLSRHIFALALALSLLIHLGLFFGELLPTLMSAFNTPPPPKRVNVELRALTLDDAPSRPSPSLPPPPPSGSRTPPPSGFSMPDRTTMPLGGGLRAQNKSRPSNGNGLRLPDRNNTSSVFGESSTGNNESSEPARQNAANASGANQAASEPVGQRQQTAQANQPGSEAPQPNKTVVTANARPPGAGGKALGARDARGMIVSSQNLQGLPSSAKLTYLEKNFGVPGTMEWRRDGDRYELTLTVKPAAFIKTIQYHSSGTIDPKLGLRPGEFQEKRGGTLRRHAKFDWDNHLLTYGDKSDNQTELKDGAQDLLSLSWQLALKGAQLDGATQLTNGGKVYEYPIRPGDGVIFDGDNGALRAKVVQTHYDKESVDVWLAPDFANIPIRIIFSKPGEPRLDLQITGIELNGVEEWGRPDQKMKKRE